MSTKAQAILDEIRALPPAEQRAVCQALARNGGFVGKSSRRRLQRLPDGSYFNPDGIPNDDPVFEILDEIEVERHQTPGPNAPNFS